MPTDIDRLDDMFGEEPEGESPAPVYSGTAFLPIPAPESRDRPPADPLQWKAFEKRFGSRPYPTPKDEYIQNRFVLNMQTLLYRWAGLGFDREIYDIYADEQTALERAKVQNIRRREMGFPDPKDKRDMETQTAYQIQICKNRIDYLNYVLEQNVDITVEQYFSIERGTEFKEAIRPLSQQARARADKDLREYVTLYRTLTGQSAKTVTHDHNVNFKEALDDAMRSNKHRTAGGYTIEELQAIVDGRALPEGGSTPAIEGEIISEPDKLPVERKPDHE